MGTLARAVSFYIDGAKSGGLNALLDGTTSAMPSLAPALMAGDKCACNLFFRERDSENGASDPMDLPAGSTIVMAARLATADSDVLFVSSDFAGGEGESWDGTIDLNTTPITTAMANVKYGSAVDINIDIEVRDAGDTERLTFRFAAKLYRQIYEGGVAPSVVVLPAAILESPDGSRWQLSVDDNGQIAAERIA